MKRVMICTALVICMIFTLVGCSGSSKVGFTFTVDNGDKIKIVLNTTDGYKFDASSPFVISQGDKTLSQGLFISAEDYQKYVDTVSESSDAKVLQKGEKDGYEYIMWSFSNGESSEWNYAVQITEKTGILLGNDVSEETAKACFDRLTFSVED